MSAEKVLYLIEKDSLVLHFGGRGSEIDAGTFGRALIALNDAARAIGASLDPFDEFELIVTAVGPGSFRAKVGTKKKRRGRDERPQWRDDVRGIILGVIASIIYENVFSDKDALNIVATDTAYVIEHGDTRIILPAEVASAKDSAERVPAVRRGLTDFFGALERDHTIESFGLVQDLHATDTTFVIDRERFPVVRMSIESNAPPSERRRVQSFRYEQVVVTKAILQRSTRKWEFIWRGFKVSARIADEWFFQALEARDVALRHADVLVVDIEVHQRWDDANATYVNEEYVVTRVHGLEPPTSTRELML